MTEELPFAGETLELPLTDAQVALLSPTLVLARCHEKAVIFCVATESYVASAGGPVARLQAKVVDRKVAAKVMKLLRQAKL